jgi:exopolysaccharide biosynthesis WecB/TagA/CpsF family protein
MSQTAHPTSSSTADRLLDFVLEGSALEGFVPEAPVLERSTLAGSEPVAFTQVTTEFRPAKDISPALPPVDATAVVPLLGLDFADLSLAQAAQYLAERPADAPFSYVVTPNADHLVRLSRDPRLTAIYRNAELRMLDSRVVRGLGRRMGLAVPQVVPGSDLTAYLLAKHLRPGEQITIVGLSPIWLPALVARCGLAPPAHYNPPRGFVDDSAAFDATVSFVQANPARFVFLAVGSPQQEYLAAAIAIRGGATGTGLCIGASLEFMAGARKRAPEFMSQAGLEWLFRLGSEPRRLFRRYLVDSPVVIALLLKQRLANARAGQTPRG